MSLRAFVAVVPPSRVVAELDSFLEPRRDADRTLRWTLPASWHLTLAFLPAVPDDRVDALIETLSLTLAGSGAFELGLAGAGAFPHPDRAKVLWLGVFPGAEALGRLSARSRAAASRAGVQPDGAALRPHLTLARAGGVPVMRWLRVLEALPPVSWEVEEVELIRSAGLPGGAGYQSLARIRVDS